MANVDHRQIFFWGGRGRWADDKVEGVYLGFYPVLVLFLCLFFIFNVELLSCMLISMWKDRKSSTLNIGTIQERVFSEHSRGREMKRRGRRGPWRVDGPAGPCVMCQFASVPLLCGWCWNAGKELVYWIRSHVNSSCQHVITPLDKERGFLFTHIWFLVTATHSPEPFRHRAVSG